MPQQRGEMRFTIAPTPHLLNNPIIPAFASVAKCGLKPATAAEVSASERVARAENKALDIYSYRTIFPIVSSARGRSHEASCGREEMRRPRASLAATLPGGPGTRSGGITTAPQGACWTGTVPLALRTGQGATSR